MDTKSNISFLITSIEDLIAEILNKKYGYVDNDIRLVRQKRYVVDSQLEYIDFAMPCFGIAKILNISPSELAKIICSEVKKIDLRYTQCESISGYLNFELDLSYNKIEHDDDQMIRSHVVNNDICIFSMAKSIKNEILIKSLVSIVDTVKGGPGSVTYFEFNEIESDEESKFVFSTALKALYANESCKVVLDKFGDAAYAVINGVEYPLRDARGNVLKFAKLISFYASLKITDTAYLVGSFADLECAQHIKEGVGIKNELTFLNPDVVRADINEISLKLRDLKADSLYSIIYETTAELYSHKQDPKLRMKLLDLMCFKSDINLALKSRNLPLFFDVVNQALDAIIFQRNVYLVHG